MSHYDKLRQNNASCQNIDDEMGFTYEVMPDLYVQKLSSKTNKHCEGKAHGARFCYLSSLVPISDYRGSQLHYIATFIDDLVHGATDVSYYACIRHCSYAIGGDKQLWDGVIAVRRKALKSGKYTLNSYKDPIEPTLLLDAMARHLISYLFTDKIDIESGENHICHIVANLIMYHHQINLLRAKE